MAIKHFDHSHQTVDQVRNCRQSRNPLLGAQHQVFSPEGDARRAAAAVEEQPISEAGQRLARAAGIPLEEIEAGRANWRQPEAEYATVGGTQAAWYPEAGAEQAQREDAARERANASRRAATVRKVSFNTSAPLASPKSKDYCRSLAESKEIPSHFQFRVTELIERIESATQREVSKMIDALKVLPAKASAPAQTSTAAQTDLPDVPAGRYALRTDGVVKFYVLDRPESGKWAGYTFLKAQASDDKYPIRNLQAKREILARIAEDVNAAQVLYGQELGRCYACGRTLTDETSRALGIGPDCRSK